MGIVVGQPIVASDFINESEKDATPANDAGRVPKLEADGKLSPFFTSGSVVRAKLTAAEALVAGNAVALAIGSTNLVTTFSSSYNSRAGYAWEGQTFVAPYTGNLTTAVVNINSYTSSGTCRAILYAVSGGIPVGSALATSADITVSSTGNKTFTFSSPYKVQPDVTYAIAFQRVSGNYEYGEHATSDFSGGTIVWKTDGVNWSAGAGDILGSVTIDNAVVAGKVVKTKANINGSTPTEFTTNFIGFVQETVAIDEEVEIAVAGVSETLSGLTLGSHYYLSNTAGAIATSAGSVSKKVGLALSTTKILIKNENA